MADLESQEKREKKEKKGKILEELPLLAKKPFLIVLNVDEHDLPNASSIEERVACELGLEDPARPVENGGSRRSNCNLCQNRK